MNLTSDLNPRGRKFLIGGIALAAVIIISVIIIRKRHRDKIDPAFSRYIESYTAGVISRQGPIRIKLANEVQTSHARNEQLKDGIFDISPSVDGKAYWVDEKTIEFRPDKGMKADQQYEVEFKLDEVAKVEEDLDEFKFSFETIKPDLNVEYDGLQTATNTSLNKMKLTGVVSTADVEDPALVEKILSVNYGTPTKISWEHNAAARTHRFMINNIQRSAAAATNLEVNYNGDALNIDKKESTEMEIPKIGELKVMAIKAVQDQEQYVLVQLSNPIMVGQELSGLTGISNTEDDTYTIDGSQIKIYATKRLEGNYTAFANEGIEDITHKKTNKAFTANLFFENRLPSVTIPGKGVILPDSGKLLMPFEAVNLNAVDVSIIKIYENNIPQYFQTNGFDGNYQLRQVGRPVLQKTIRLDTDKGLNLTRKNRFMLDVDHLMRTEPGAIYRVVIGFRQEYSLFKCTAKGQSRVTENSNSEGEEGDYEGEEGGGYGEKIDEDDEFWARYDNYYPSGYKWEEREDACSRSYYTKDRWATRNILASNIGLIAKRGTDNSMVIAVTNIMDAQPMSGVTLELLDYQRQVIATSKSDGDGLAKFAVKRKPYLLVAKNGDERGYLKLDDASSLPLTRFNVGGEEVQKGLKGFIYGERGVWRPGDSIFVSFILEDKQHTLPADHPVDFELYDPKGQLYTRMTRTRSLDGFYSFHTATNTSSPTGNWSAKVKVGGAVFEKMVKVETIMPNRLKIDLSFGNRAQLTKGSTTDGRLNARWLFGGVAQNLKAKVDAFVSAQRTTFKGLDDFSFDDPTLAFNTQTQTVFDGKLDENGNADINADINVQEQAPGQLRANFLVKVFEPGGNFSIQQTTLPYNVYDGYVGIRTPEGKQLSGMLETGKEHSVDIVDVNSNGLINAGVRDVQIEMYKIQWRWWWDKSEDELSNFTQDQYNKLVVNTTVRLNGGRGKWNFKVDNDHWGRYLIKVRDPQTGHSTGKVVYLDWPNWADRLQQDNATEAAMLSFTADKQKYKVGEQVTLTIPTGAAGRALVSIENGSHVLKTDWINTEKGQTRYSFKLEPGMAPNVFATVTVLQRHAQTLNDLPIRQYGALAIEVEDPETVLKPVISMPDKIRPETRSEITVSETSGKEMTYTVALVDEGLLDLTNFKTPDPHKAFYAREGLGVKTWDLFDYVIGAFGGGLERILSIGGDGSGVGNGKNVQVNRFKPVVKFMGPFKLGKGQKQTHQFILPQYIGSVRAMVIAGHDGSYGFAEKPVAVKKPLMILATLPRVLGPSEKVQLPVTVFATESNLRTVTVKVVSNAFSNPGSSYQKVVTFAKPGDQLVSFDLDVKSFVGVGKVKITAQSGSEKADFDVELNVRNPNPPITSIIEKELGPGESWSTAYTALGMSGTNKATLEVSSIPALNLSKRLSYLIQYPHGCVEQTTSSVFPQLYLGQLMSLDVRQKQMTDRNIKAAISRLNGFQVPGGGMSYWPDGGEPDEWGTNYAGHFMLAAQAKGYVLPAGFLDQWKRFQKQKAQNWSPDLYKFYDSGITQAYRLYLLAMAGVPELGAMNRLKEMKYLSPEAKWRLAAAYKLAGQPEVGSRMVANLSLTVKPYRQMAYTYGSDLRDEAMILETLTLLGQRQKASRLVYTVAAKLSQDEWYSTQTTAYSLLAVAQYCGHNRSGNRLQFDVQAGALKIKVNTDQYLWQNPISSSGGNAMIRNSGKTRLYIRLIQQGQPALGQEVPTNINPDVLQMSVNYYSLTGKPIDPSVLKQGTDFVAQVIIKNPGQRGNYSNMALTQIFPSGWEILNTRMLNNDEVFKSSPSDYRDVRDDRVNTYFGLPADKEVTYYVMLNASYTGRFYLPAVYCEAMYDTSINALQSGQWVEVVK